MQLIIRELKQLLCALLILLFASCDRAHRTERVHQNVHSDSFDVNQQPTDSLPVTPTATDTEYFRSELQSQFERFQLHSLRDTLREDFNGDGQADEAIFTTENGRSGILILHGSTNERVKVGLGIPFEEMGDDFSWVDYWAIVKDSSTYEILIDDAEIIGDTTVGLEQPSITVRKVESGGGVITFRRGKYQWVHQAH